MERWRGREMERWRKVWAINSSSKCRGGEGGEEKLEERREGGKKFTPFSPILSYFLPSYCLCLCLFVCVCLCVYVYVCMYVCMYVYMYVCVCMYVCKH